MGASPDISVWGSLRSPEAAKLLPSELRAQLVTGIDVESDESLKGLFALAAPDVVINCVGVVKQLSVAADPLVAIPINSLLPHRLARLTGSMGARLIHISTDCVFLGTRGMYREDEPSDAISLYGRSKYLGEVSYSHTVTLRTSMIGHELADHHGLVEWFLSRQGRVNGFTRAIFSGLPTVELSRVIRDFVIPCQEMRGVYHVSAEPISKFDLLRLVAEVYEKKTEIVPDESLVVDRSLDSSRFRALTGYAPLSWPDMVRGMRAFG
jgi:dTDP-4-dehydrorhamnose reductase